MHALAALLDTDLFRARGRYQHPQKHEKILLALMNIYIHKYELNEVKEILKHLTLMDK